jgi:enoyl-CoA hydratase/carnithine racemase
LDHVLVTRDGDIATVTLNNPERLNALSLAMWERLGVVAKELDADDQKERANSRQAKEYGRRIALAMQSFAACSHPVVALIQGACVGGGLLVVSQCDLRICNESARFGVPVKNLGLVEAGFSRETKAGIERKMKRGE